MPEFNVLDQIRKLVRLQESDAEVFNLRKDLKEKPAQIQQIEKEFELKKIKLKQLEQEMKKLQVERSTLEGDLAQKEQEIKKVEGQLSQIKTNKEYTAKIGEIEGLKADKSIIEEKILELYDRTDEFKVQVENERVVVAKEEQEFLAKAKKAGDELKDLEAMVKESDSKRVVLLDGIDKNLLDRYEKILNSRDGLAVVPVHENVCGGCFMNVPHQVINEIRKKKEIVACEICTRILFLEDELNK
ncbi:MAG: C4-type zinc ribbon domain-containing protein [Candidatus Omnitrophota bacterium]